MGIRQPSAPPHHGTPAHLTNRNIFFDFFSRQEPLPPLDVHKETQVPLSKENFFFWRSRWQILHADKINLIRTFALFRCCQKNNLRPHPAAQAWGSGDGFGSTRMTTCRQRMFHCDPGLAIRPAALPHFPRWVDSFPRLIHQPAFSNRRFPNCFLR